MIGLLAIFNLIDDRESPIRVLGADCKDKLPAEVTEQILSTVVSDEARVVGSNRVRLNDGQLQGSVVALLGKESVEGTYVHIIQDNQQIAEVQADASGSFMVADLEPGFTTSLPLAQVVSLQSASKLYKTKIQF